MIALAHVEDAIADGVPLVIKGQKIITRGTEKFVEATVECAGLDAQFVAAESALADIERQKEAEVEKLAADQRAELEKKRKAEAELLEKKKQADAAASAAAATAKAGAKS